MDGQVSEQVKSQRSQQMIELGEKKQKAYEQSFIGREVEVLIEETAEIDGRTVQVGHTKEYIKIALDAQENLKNCVVKVQIENDSQIIH